MNSAVYLSTGWQSWDRQKVDGEGEAANELTLWGEPEGKVLRIRGG